MTCAKYEVDTLILLGIPTESFLKLYFFEFVFASFVNIFAFVA